MQIKLCDFLIVWSVIELVVDGGYVEWQQRVQQTYKHKDIFIGEHG